MFESTAEKTEKKVNVKDMTVTCFWYFSQDYLLKNSQTKFQCIL